MDRNEKLFLLEHILRDIRGNWGWDLESRAKKALELAQELDLKQHIQSINNYISMCIDGNNDGRYFRMHYQHGGYEDMCELHGLDTKKEGKSQELIDAIQVELTYPDYAFDDEE